MKRKKRNRPSLEIILPLYKEFGNVHKVAKATGACHSYVHKKLTQAGIMKNINVFTVEERLLLKREYIKYRDQGKLDDLAKKMGRTKPFICRQAKELGLTDRSCKRPYFAKLKYLTDEEAQKIWDNFKASPYTMGRWCNINNIGEVTFWQYFSTRFPDEWEHVIESKTPKETMYRRGRRFEYKIRDHLKSLGYIVTRSPASRSPIDLIAIAEKKILFIQCKVGGYLSPIEWNEIYDLAESVKAVPLLAQRNGVKGMTYLKLIGKKDGSRKRQPAIKYNP